MKAERVIRVFHLDVFMVVVGINIIGMTTQNQHDNVVLVLNVYAKQKHVSTVLPVHIKTKQVLLRVKPVRLGRTLPSKDKLVAKHVNKDIHVMQAGTNIYVLPVHIKTKQVLPVLVKPVMQENMDSVKLKHQKMKHVLNVIPARFPQKDRQNVQHA